MSNLSKNITSRDEATNDLEKLVANMTGANIPEEQTSGLGKELKKILPGAGGLLPEYSNPEVGKVLGVEMEQSDIILFDCRIPNRDVRLSPARGETTYVGSYPGFKAINDEIIGCYIIIGNTVVPTECIYIDRGGEIYIEYEDYDITYRFYSNGKYTIVNHGEADFTVHPSRISVTAYVSVPTAIWRDDAPTCMFLVEVGGKESGNTYTLSNPTKTSEEIISALEGGKLPMMKVNIYDDGSQLGDPPLYFFYSYFMGTNVSGLPCFTINHIIPGRFITVDGTTVTVMQ